MIKRRKARSFKTFVELHAAVVKRALVELEESTGKSVRVTAFERTALDETLREDRRVEQDIRRAITALERAVDQLEEACANARESADLGGATQFVSWASSSGPRAVEAIRTSMNIPWYAQVRPTEKLAMIVWMIYEDRRQVLGNLYDEEGKPRLLTIQETARYAIVNGYMPSTALKLSDLTDGAVIKRAVSAVRNEIARKGYRAGT